MYKSFTYDKQVLYKIKLNIVLVALFGTVISIGLITPNHASAATQKLSRGLTVAPLRTELSIAPGASLDGELKAANRTADTMKVSPSARVFKVINEQYDYAFVDNKSDGGEPGGWIRFDETTFTLKPNEEKIIKYRVAVPLSAEPGGRYISLFVGADTNGERSDTPSKQQIASLLYVTVKGNVTRTGSFLGIQVPWVTSKDIAWSARVRNSGTTHFRSRYTVVARAIDGSVAVDHRGDALILPASVRLVSDSVPIRWPGVYKIDFTIGLGDNPAHKETRWVLYSPPYATAIGIFFLLMASIIFGRRKHQARTRVKQSAIQTKSTLKE